MILYNHPAEKFLGEFLVNWRPAERSHPHPPQPRESAYNEQDSLLYQRSEDTWMKKASILNA